MIDDVRFALRRLVSRPAHTGLMVLILAFGIGGTTTVFTAVDQTVLRRPPFRNADRLVEVLHLDRPGGGGGSSLSPEKIAGWQSQPAIFERFEGYAPQQFEIFGGGEPERLLGTIVTVDLFGMLGVAPRMGRTFIRPEGQPGSERVVILSDALWRGRFAGDPAVVGRTINLNGDAHRIIGVMPRAFRLLGASERLFVPIDVHSPAIPGLRSFFGLAWLRGGVSVAAAQEYADATAASLATTAPLPEGWYLGVQPRPITYVDASARRALLLLLGAVALVLLLACTNVANLFLVRTAEREREISVRAALGASRPRLIREVLVESLLLSCVGGAAGLVVALWGIDAITAAAPASMSFLTNATIALDGRVFLVTAGATVVGILCGVVPAIRGSGVDLERDLRGSSASVGHAGLRPVAGGLLATETAVAVILLVGAALMTRTFARLNAIDPGFDPNGVLTVRIALPNDRYPTEAARNAFFDELAGQLEQRDGVERVGVARGMIPGGSGFTYGLRADSDVTLSEEVALNDVTPGFFTTLRIPVVEGRLFAAGERNTAVVSRSLATTFWGAGPAIGRRLRFAQEWQTVVGVVGNVENRMIGRRFDKALYLPFVDPLPAGPVRAPLRRAFVPRVLIVRSANLASALAYVKERVRSMDPSQPVENAALAADVYADAFDRERFVLLLMGLFSGVALLLAAAGVFAVVSQSVAQRTREIGLRIALGATGRDIVRLVARHGLLFAGIGTLVGVAGAAALSRLMTSLLFEVSPYDAVSYITVASGLMAAACVASWLPTRRALRVDPAVALRLET